MMVWIGLPKRRKRGLSKMGTMINACGFGTAKKYSEMTEIEKAKADLDYAKRKGGFAYKQALAHYRNILRKLR